VRLFITIVCFLVFAVGTVLGSDKTPGPGSRFGIDYVFAFDPEYQNDALAEKLSEIKAGWVNFAGISWKDTEPNPPQLGVHTYNWTVLDKTVKVWQNHGFQIAISIRLNNGWFAGRQKHKPAVDFPLLSTYLNSSDRLPEPKYMDSFRAWVSALVERYDGDGEKDMPGLKYPILHYQVGNEYANPMFWTGTSEDYKVLLSEFASAAKKSCVLVKIISNGIRWNDMFHGDPEGVLLERRFAVFLKALPSEGWRQEFIRARKITEDTVALAGIYDILDGGGNGPYPTMSRGYMAWMKKELAKSNKTTTIWDMEARCEPQIAPIPNAGYHPSLNVPDGKKILAAMNWKIVPRHIEAIAWYRAEQARTLVQVFVARFAAGFEKVFMGMPSDWNGTLAALSVPNPYLGLLDRERNPWPAFFAFRELAAKLDGFIKAERIENGKNVEMFKFSFPEPKKMVWVVWLNENKTRGMDDPLPKANIVLKEFTATASVQLCPTTNDACVSTSFSPSPGGLALEISPTPIIIEEK